MPQRRHLELDRHQAQLLDRAGATYIAPADERDRFAAPLDEREVHRVLQHARVPVVVFRHQHDEGLGRVDSRGELGHLVAAVIAWIQRRRRSFVVGQRVIA